MDRPPQDISGPGRRGGFWDQPVIRYALPGKNYTRFVRSMRLLLPLIAASVIGLIMVWAVATFTFFLVHNLTECTILVQNCLEWSLCIATVIGSDAMLLRALSTKAEERQASRAPVAEYA